MRGHCILKLYTIFLCRIMIFSQSVAATLVIFDHSGDIIHINISTSVGVEPANAACAPSTATSDVLNNYTIEASQINDAQEAYITTPDAAVPEHPFLRGCLDGVMVKDARCCSARRARRNRGFNPQQK